MKPGSLSAGFSCTSTVKTPLQEKLGRCLVGVSEKEAMVFGCLASQAVLSSLCSRG